MLRSSFKILQSLSLIPFETGTKQCYRQFYTFNQFLQQYTDVTGQHYLFRIQKDQYIPPLQELIPPLEPRPFTPKSMRTGVIAIKGGMTQEWNEHGVKIPLTVIWIDDCQVVKCRTYPHDGISSMQLGAGIRKKKRTRRHMRIDFERRGLPYKRRMAEFKCTPDALLPVGTQITAAHFKAGQYVDVVGKTKGKGYQGVVKRWGFAGGPASHGSTKFHRKTGSIGDKGSARVRKGKRMPGRMGGDMRNQRNCWVYRVDAQRNLLWVKGCIPGGKGGWIFVRDAWKKPWELKKDLPFPTYIGDELPPAETAVTAKNPYHVFDMYDN
eukprot:TRINITY_DN3361_c0_g2_i1.p1 TRINITY_DN3361_c0_g2~~TRINITY_DN3361_c0_g2_i1.p1  ORF type:complete len:333 (-),score=33.66 TRINITY_DN3361_c0_g2_i1:129-1100(-)